MTERRTLIFDTNLLSNCLRQGLSKLTLLVQVLRVPKEYRSEHGLHEVMLLLKSFTSFITSLNINDSTFLNKILKEYAKDFRYKTYRKGEFISHIGDRDTMNYLIFSGAITKLSLHYEKMRMTQNEYFIYLLKLISLKEFFLLLECIKLNRNIFNITENPETWGIADKIEFDQLKNVSQAQIASSSYHKTKDSKDYITLTSPKIRVKANEKETHYMLIIPKYFIEKTYNRGEPIGTMANTKHVKLYSSYYAEETTDVLYISKNEDIVNLDGLYYLINMNERESLEEIYNSFYIFHDIPLNTFIDTFMNFFIYKKVKKGDSIITQNQHCEGVYFTMNGNFKISTRHTFKEINQLIANLKESLDTFNSNSINSLNRNVKKEFPCDNFVGNPIFNSEEFYIRSNEKINIILSYCTSKQILGLNEFYHFRTEINHFNVECVSDEGELYYIPKENFHSMINKVSSFSEKIKKMIEQKVKFYSITLKRYKENFLKEIEEKIKKNNKRKIKVLLLKNRSKSTGKMTIKEKNKKIPLIGEMKKSSSVITIKPLKQMYNKPTIKESALSISCNDKKLSGLKSTAMSTTASFFDSSMNRTQMLSSTYQFRQKLNFTRKMTGYYQIK